MVSLGLVQAGSFAIAGDVVFSSFGVVYAILGVGFLWAEVYSTAA